MPPGAAARWTNLFNTHRQRLARLVLLIAALAIGLSLWSEVPRQTELQFWLGEQHRAVVEVRVQYLRDGESYHGVRFDFPSGAPEMVPHAVSLPAGHFHVQLDLLSAPSGDMQRTVHPLTTPADGLVRIRAR